MRSRQGPASSTTTPTIESSSDSGGASARILRSRSSSLSTGPVSSRAVASLAMDSDLDMRGASLSTGPNQSGVVSSLSIDSNLPLSYANNVAIRGDAKNDTNDLFPYYHAVRPDFATRKAKGCSLNDEVHCSTGRCDDAVQRGASSMSMRLGLYVEAAMCGDPSAEHFSYWSWIFDRI